MAIRPDYDVGLITLVSGSNEFTTSGASLQSAAVLGGDSIITPSGDVLIIEEITGQNSGKLFLPCPPSAAGNDLPLRIRYQPDGSRYQGAVRELIARWGTSGNVDALAGLVGAADKIPYFTGIGTMSLVDMSSLGGGGSGGSWDALVGTLAGRDAFNSEGDGFRVLVIDNGNGQAVIYQKTGDGSEDWSAPIPFTGARGNDGPPNTLTIGSVTEGPVAYASITGTSPNQVLNLVLQKGEKGEKGDTGDVTPEALDAAQRAEDAAAQSIANATLTNQDAIATAADRVQTGLDRAAASDSAAEANQDAIATAADRVQTGLDRTAASNSAAEAATQANAASTSASDASASAAQALADKNIAESAKNSAVSAASDAESAKTMAETAASDAESAKDFAYQWSSAPEGQAVNDGTNSGYSAYHWSKVAETAAGGGILSVNGKTGSDIVLVPSDIGAATAAQGDKADSAVQTITAGDNITVSKSGTTYTVNATATPQVQSDWNATSGLGQILNKPTLGTAAAQDVDYFATAAQGVKADTALQTLTAGSNITISGTGTSRTIAATVPPAPVTSVNSKTGAVELNAGDVSAVSYEQQTLTTAQKTQARQNIDALSTSGKSADSSLLNGQTAAQLPVSNATQTALNGKFNNPTGTVNQFIRGNGTLQSIVGTAAQSGGAIVQRGSNASGEFTRFADGTQICWARVTMTQYSNASYRMSADWSYPAQFVSPPNIIVNLPMVNQAEFVNLNGEQGGRLAVKAAGGGAVTTTNITTQVTAFFDSGTVSTNSSITNVHVGAIGRWF